MTDFTTIKHLCRSTALYHSAKMLYWHLLRQDYLAKFYQEVTSYSELLEPNSLCFDVGANIGEKTEKLLKAGMKVVAFEPQAGCMRELEARCRHYRSKLVKCRYAIGAEPGDATLYIHKYHCHSSLNRDWSESKVITSTQVSMITLDQAIAEFGKPKYCKIDVEGWEYEVIKGLTQPVPLLSFEYHLQENNIHQTFTCLNYLSSLGELRINITPAEKLLFTFQEWVTLEEFIKLFPDIFQLHEEYNYGDIFVCIR